MNRLVKFDAIRVGELSANFINANTSLTAKAAFVNTQSGSTHGWTNGGNWSQETFNRLQLLRESMEQDLEAVHFDDVSGAPLACSNTANTGLGEFLGSVPQA